MIVVETHVPTNDYMVPLILSQKLAGTRTHLCREQNERARILYSTLFSLFPQWSSEWNEDKHVVRLFQDHWSAEGSVILLRKLCKWGVRPFAHSHANQELLRDRTQ